jgi:homospermidine synthase
MLKNPRLGVVEPEAMDFEEILEVATPYLGPVVAVHTDWRPTENRSTLYTLDPVIDKNNPFSLNNFLIRY